MGSSRSGNGGSRQVKEHSSITWLVQVEMIQSLCLSVILAVFSSRYLELSQLRTSRFNTSSLLAPSTSPQSSFTKYTERYAIFSLTHSQQYVV